MHSNDKHGRLARALELIEAGGERDLVYAALELRQLLEPIVYQRLEGYSEYVPAAVTSAWQPAHALKMLLRFEPEADKQVSLRIAEESPSGETVGQWIDFGTVPPIDARWLTKRYNQLGNYVHVPRGKAALRSQVKLRKDLELIAGEITPIVEARLMSVTLDQRVTFECAQCDKRVIANVDHLRETGRVACMDPNCGAVHVAEELDDIWSFHLDFIEAPCFHCDETIRFERRHIMPGALVKCPACGTEHEVALGWRLASDGESAAS